MPKLCYSVASIQRTFVPRSLLFVRTTCDAWTICLSRKANRKYFFDTRTGESMFDMPGNKRIMADIRECFQRRLQWWWPENSGGGANLSSASSTSTGGSSTHKSNSLDATNATPSLDDIIKFVQERQSS